MAARNEADLLERARAICAGAESAARLRAMIDLTSLNDDDTPAHIEALCAKAREHATAAVCVYPAFVAQARTLLAGSPIKVATVVNFPAGGEDIAAVVEQTRHAVASGAHEIDQVVPIDAVLEGDVGLVTEMGQAVIEACGPAVVHKTILETARLADADTITAAARAAVMAGTHFLKTSTGKAAEGGADLEAAAVLLAICAEADGKVGFKASGGIRTADQAAQYLFVAEQMLGKDWATADRLRFGASSLLDDVLRIEVGRASAPGKADGY